MESTRTDAIGRRRYVEAVPRSLLVAAVADASGEEELRVLVKEPPRRNRVLLSVQLRRLRRRRRHEKDVDGPAPVVRRLACGLLWVVVVMFSP